MKLKKITIGILSGTIILLAAGTYTFAQTNGNVPFSFKEMQPYIEKMHPNLSAKEQQEMFDTCHGENGVMQNNRMKKMMNN